jgi:hypothetical protein
MFHLHHHYYLVEVMSEAYFQYHRRRRARPLDIQIHLHHQNHQILLLQDCRNLIRLQNRRQQKLLMKCQDL